MNTLSVTSTTTMTYCAIAAARDFALAERLASLAGALLRAARRIGPVTSGLPFRHSAAIVFA